MKVQEPGTTVDYSNADLLIADDSQDDIDLVLHALRHARLAGSISVVRDGEEALDFLFCRAAFSHRSFARQPRLVLLDLKLPKIDGLQVLREIKSDPRTQPIPVVIMTSSREERDIVQSYRAGGNSYIQKPSDFAQFREAMNALGRYWMVVNQPPMSQWGR